MAMRSGRASVTVSSVRREAFDGLLRQAVDQVDVHRAEAAVAAGRDRRQRLLDRLHAVHRALHHRIEVLHTETGAAEAAAPRNSRCRRCCRKRGSSSMEKSRLALRGQVEVRAQALHELEDLLGPEEIRRAAAEVHLHDFAVAVEPGRDQFDLACQAQQVGRGARRVARDDAIAAAVEAGAEAERHVHVDRQRRAGWAPGCVRSACSRNCAAPKPALKAGAVG